MATADSCCTIAPYLKVQEGRMQEFRALCERCVEKAMQEPGCLYYGFSFDGDEAHCREGYADAAGVLAHLENVGELLEEILKISEIARLEVHGPEEELARLREPLAGFSPRFFTLEYGFRH